MFARRSVLVIANSLLGAALGFVSLFAMARLMGAELVGAQAYVLASVYLVGLVCRLGFPVTHTRRIARGDNIAGSMGTYLALKLALTAGFVLFAVGLGWLWFAYLGRTPEDVTVQALWLGVAVVVAKSLKDVAINTFGGLQKIRYREISLFSNTFISVALTVLVAIAYAQSHGRWSPFPMVSEWAAGLLSVTGPVGFDQGLLWLMMAFLTGEVVALAVSMGLLWRTHVPIGAPQSSIARDYLRATIPIMVVSTAAVLMRRMDQVMIGFWSDNAAVGHYAGATKLSEFVLILANGVRVSLLPIISRLHKEGRIDAVAQTVLQAERWISILVWPVLLVGWTATKPTIHIVLSDAFLAGAPMMILLLGNSLLISMTVPLRTKAFGFGEQKFAGRVALWALGVNLVLNLLLIPKSLMGVPLAGLGGVGASIATLAAGVVLFAAYRGKAHEWTEHPYFSRRLQRHLLAAALTLGSLLLLGQVLPDILRIWDLLLYGALTVLIFGGFLAILGELRRGDWDDIKSMLSGRSPKKAMEVDPS